MEARLGCYDRAGERTYLALVRDITERKEAVERLQRSEANLAQAQHLARIGSWELEIATSALSWSAEIYKIFGMDPAAFGASYEAFLATVHPEDRARVNAAQQAALAGESRLDLEHRLVRPDGTERIVHELAVLTRDAEGRPAFLVGTVQDITERVQAAAKLRESDETFSAAFRASPMAMVITTLEGRYVEANDAYAALIGYSREEIIGRTTSELGVLPTDAGTEPVRALDRAGGTLSGLEFELRHRDGTLRTVIAGVTEITLQGRRHRLSTAIEVTDQRRAEHALRQLNSTLEQHVARRTEQLEAANRELAEHATAISHDLRVAEAADRLKSAFLATMSHELRTPLNSIIGFTGIVLAGKAGPINPEQTKQLGMVRGSARHLLELINDVLDLSKIEAGQIEVRVESFDLRASIERVVASVAPQAEKKALTLDARRSRRSSARWSATAAASSRSCSTSINNALKFTDRGGVTLTVELPAAPQPVVRFRVADTGMGITAADLTTLFQPFRQLDTGLARQSEGTGLGLAICRRLATLLGGEISAISEPGHGSEFIVTLPLQKIP